MTTTCPGCGKPVDLSRRGYCALCGTNAACVPEGRKMKSFLRYFCFYCASRLLFGWARTALRQKPSPTTPCARHGHGLALTLFVLLPFAGIVFLIVVGFLQRP
jgi:hypothetical protein